MPYWFQRLAAAAALVVSLPLLLIVAAVVLVTSGRPVFFLGTRVGKGGEQFEQIKFRTMIRDADLYLDPVTGEPTKDRITRIGRFLRTSSIDEIPQLANIVQGHMALVGPRPLLVETAAKISPSHPRFDVLPGITGLAQVSGRNQIPWSRRIELDAQYVEQRSLRLDLQLLARTAVSTLGREGIVLDRNAGEVMDL